MKRLISILLLFFAFATMQAQLQNILVEKYYISDANDANDIQYYMDDLGNVVDTVRLEVGSTTYRIYIKLSPGYLLSKVYGDANHALKFASNSYFYNHLLGSSFGKDISNARLKSKTLALDSWLTLGLATKTKLGTLKTQDKDGSLIGGSNSGGYLVNNDAQAGIPLTSEDGLSPITISPANWITFGFVNAVSGNDSTIFGSLIRENQFISNTAFIQNSGIAGSDTSNNILVAQLTTKGDISFELNIQVKKADGSSTVNYVAKRAPGDAGSGNVYSQLLTYPPAPSCGCKDPDFLEYNPELDCNIQDSCKTQIVYGCMDPQACNYNPNANYSVKSLCCYPGMCSDRDISQVCPDLESKMKSTVLLYPNPVNSELNLEVTSDKSIDMEIEIYNSFGKLIAVRRLTNFSGSITSSIDMSYYENGIYLVKYHSSDFGGSKIFIKN